MYKSKYKEWNIEDVGGCMCASKSFPLIDDAEKVRRIFLQSLKNSIVTYNSYNKKTYFQVVWKKNNRKREEILDELDDKERNHREMVERGSDTENRQTL